MVVAIGPESSPALIVQASIRRDCRPGGAAALDASTYVVSFNLLAAASAALGLLPFLSRTPPALVSLKRPYLPGQGLFSGFRVVAGVFPSYDVRVLRTVTAGSRRTRAPRGRDDRFAGGADRWH